MEVAAERPSNRPRWVALACLALLSTSAVRAQMVTGRDMIGFAAAFGLDAGQAAKNYTVDQLEIRVAGRPTVNVLTPGEQPELILRFVNQSDARIAAKGGVEVVHWATKAKPGDVWSPNVVRLEMPDGESNLAISVELPAKGAQEITVRPRIPETYGGYALVVELEGQGRQFVASVVRVVAPDLGRVQFPTYALDGTWPEFMNENVFVLFQKLGIKGARLGANFTLPSAPDFEEQTAKYSQYIEWAGRHDVTAMLTVDNGTAPMPLGRPRPWLDDKDRMLDTKDDRAWLPEHDVEFREWAKRIATRYGWPNGPVNAMELWNEPWEGISISGWGADIPRFRSMYEQMALGIEDARREGGVKVLIGGACSSTNTRDKLFPDGSNKFLKWLDFVSIHYQPLSADPAITPEWVRRKAEYGPTRVWDTESWIANSEDRVAGVIASMRAQGQSRTAGIYEGNVYDSRNKKVDGRVYPVVQAWPPAAAVAATQKFIGQRAFREILFRNGLPWIFIFDGLVSKDDGSIVVVGDLGAIYDRERTLFRTVQVKRDAALTIPDGGAEFRLYDFYGNVVPATSGIITVPLNGLGYFLRSNGRVGSFARLVAALRAAHISGVEPVEIVAHDLLGAPEMKPELWLTLTNVLNHPVKGRLDAALDGLRLRGVPRSVELKAHETSTVTIPVDGGVERADNLYALDARLDTGADGTVEHHEALRVNLISKRTIRVDGDLSDWKGVRPQTVTGDGIGASLTEEAWLPFKPFGKQQKAGIATAYLAYDADNFYFAAKIADTTPDDGMVRTATRADDEFFYPPVSYDKGKPLTWPEGVRRYSYRKNFEIPSGNNHDNVQLAFNALEPGRKAFLEFAPGTMPHFMAYADTDYEFALNPVAPRFGGGTEVWRLLAPGMPRKHFYPRQPKAPNEQGAVTSARLTMRREENTRIVEAAIPWSELAEVKRRLDAGQTVKFSYRVNNNDGPALELAAGRSVSKWNSFAFHDDWSTHWANEIEFGFEK